MSNSICVLAGDLSGDRAVSLALSQLKLSHPDMTLFGLGGHNLAALGQEQFANLSTLAVFGFAEVIAKYRFFQMLLDQCEREIRERKPKVVLFVDYPGFNIRLLKRITDLQIPKIYLIPPQLWAWGGWRVKHLRHCSRLLVMLPFEEKFYRGHHLPVTFVKHYLLDEIDQTQVMTPRRTSGSVLLLPGSRPGEIARHLPILLQTAKRIKVKRECQFVVGALTGVADYEGMVREAGIDVQIRYDETRSLIVESSLVLAASGTVVLECALLGRPSVVMFRTSWFNYQLAKRLVVVKHIALPNLIAEKTVFPEYIQERATPELLAEQALNWLSHPAQLAQVETDLAQIVGSLGGPGFSRRVAHELEGLIYA